MALVLLNGEGDLNRPLTLTLTIEIEGQGKVAEARGILPPQPALLEQDHQWRSLYRDYQNDYAQGSEPSPEILGQCHQALHRLTATFNDWLHHPACREFYTQWAKTLKVSDPILVILRLTHPQLQQLPWQRWDWLQRYPQAAIAHFSPHHDPKEERSGGGDRDRLRLLTVLFADLPQPQHHIPFPHVETCVLQGPTPSQLEQQFWDAQGWDLLYFAGRHFPPDNFSHGLKKAVKQGLRLVILNSEPEMGCSQRFKALALPYLITMAEPMPEPLAQGFLKVFLHHLHQGHAPALALRRAVEQLPQLEPNYPGQGPLLWQHPDIDLAIVPIPHHAPPLPCPYTTTLTPNHGHALYGRQVDLEQLAYGIYRQPLVTLIGAKGSGKSALIVAGLIPQFVRETVIILFRPGRHPLENLAAALNPWLPEPDPQLAANLQTGETSLLAVIRALLQHQGRPRLLLIVDQFEELYRLGDRSTQRDFLELFLAPVHAADAATSPWHEPKFTLILVAQATGLEVMLGDRFLAPLLVHHRPNFLAPLSSKALRQAITEPAQSWGVMFAPGLVERILNPLLAEPEQLSQLGVLLTQLWEQQRDREPGGLRAGLLTHGAYEAVMGAIALPPPAAEPSALPLPQRQRSQLSKLPFVLWFGLLMACGFLLLLALMLWHHWTQPLEPPPLPNSMQPIPQDLPTQRYETPD
ncbi:ABC transporter ATP-binding protein [Spirulina sp. CCNP1310]|uniref:ATP-binding cassette domain-containing protein n=1 Tax=Spirulina sp. CCNP1310 TaxID=3110249 RepID=UPI002B1FB049|nr:ABC transporter ATP-binding protein [Spirulina sp. CCNP1310]MEA5420368.1 ABC transporter ATP-binding protein [Spirulina sp. CCNP1310]